MPPPLDIDETMEEAVVDTSPPSAQYSVAKKDLKHAFGTQEKRLKEIFQAELDKRLPSLPATTSTLSLTKQFFALWNSLATSSDPRVDQGPVVQTLLKDNSELRQEISSLQACQAQLQRDNAAYKKTCSSMTRDYDTIRRELAHERVKNKELEAKTMSLRSMLMPATESQMSDGEVVAKFSLLGSQILKLVKVAWSREIKGRLVTNEQIRLFGPFADGLISMRYLDNCLRAAIFAILHDKIFGIPHYGLDRTRVRLDDALSSVESHMWGTSSKESHALISDWRVSTMKMTATFRGDPCARAPIAYHAIQGLFDGLEPRKDKGDEGPQLLKKICEDAVDLSLMMRSAKDEWYVSMAVQAVGKPISEFQKLVEDDASHPAITKDEQPETIAYFITGALIKHPYGNMEDYKVLEKAQAAVYAQPDKKL